ncbi:hypothetical protein ACVWYG_000633 [Pedobacter sp. UYEF25]
MKRIATIGLILLVLQVSAQIPEIKIQWDHTVFTSKSTPTLQVVGNPMLRQGAPMHNAAFNALQNLDADYVRYVPWFPYPRLAVAELEPPGDKTSWDFRLIDPMTADFMRHTEGHAVMMNFSTIPQWMFKTDIKVIYPDDPNQVSWSYGGGTKFRDTTLKELTDYYVRLVSWYTKGGFTDELGKYHKSGYHYNFDYWEVLNEPDLEHNMSPQTYALVYDAIVTALKPIMPKTKFVGLALAYEKPEWFEYFLNAANHKPGIPIDMLSYHCYAGANQNQKIDADDYTVFDKAEGFIDKVRFIENIRARLAPKTRTDINELGTFVSDEMRNQPIDPKFFNISAGVYGYFFVELSKLGIDVIGESQLVGFPTQFPDVTMINHLNNKPNARYWVLKLIKDHITVGSKLIQTNVEVNNGDDILAQAYSNKKSRMLLIINKRNKTINVKLPTEFKGAEMSSVDGESGDNEPIATEITRETIDVKPFSVKLIVLTK